MYFMIYSEFRNQIPSVENFTAQNFNEIVYECCAWLVMVHVTSNCMLVVLKTINCSSIVRL